MLVPYARKNHTVSNFNPFHDFDELERAFFSDNALSEFKTDIQEDGDNFVLEADLPGFKKEDIHVDVADDRLTVTAERHSNFEDKDKKNKYVRCERSYGTYARSFDISGIDAKAIKAAYSDGVLRVTLPKQKEVPASSRRLEIEGSTGPKGPAPQAQDPFSMETNAPHAGRVRGVLLGAYSSSVSGKSSFTAASADL